MNGDSTDMVNAYAWTSTYNADITMTHEYDLQCDFLDSDYVARCNSFHNSFVGKMQIKYVQI